MNHATRRRISNYTGVLSFWFCFTSSIASGQGIFSDARIDFENGLLVHLPLTADLLDHSSNRHEVEVSGAVELRDNAAYFDGKSAWLELPHVPFRNGTFAIAVWLKATGPHAMHGVLEQRDSNEPNTHFHVMLRGDLQPYLGFYVNDLIAPISVQRNEWTHLLFQFDGTFQEIWINGHLVCRRRAAGAYKGQSGLTRLGRSPRWDNVPSRDFEGYMRAFRVYNRTLNSNEVALLRGLPVLPANAIAGRPPQGEIGPGSSTGIIRTQEASLHRPVSQPFLFIDGSNLTITGAAGQVYHLEVTTDLSLPWQSLTLLTNHSGQIEFRDAGAEQIPQRFYRIRVK